MQDVLSDHEESVTRRLVLSDQGKVPTPSDAQFNADFERRLSEAKTRLKQSEAEKRNARAQCESVGIDVREEEVTSPEGSGSADGNLTTTREQPDAPLADLDRASAPTERGNAFTSLPCHQLVAPCRLATIRWPCPAQRCTDANRT